MAKLYIVNSAIMVNKKRAEEGRNGICERVWLKKRQKKTGEGE